MSSKTGLYVSRKTPRPIPPADVKVGQVWMSRNRSGLARRLPIRWVVIAVTDAVVVVQQMASGVIRTTDRSQFTGSGWTYTLVEDVRGGA